MQGAWRCACEHDAVSIHVIEVSILVLKFAIMRILHLLPHVVKAGMGKFELELPGISGEEVVDAQHEWFGEVCV